MTIEGFVDWRGNPINREVHGGVRAAWFMYVLAAVTNMVIIPNLLNLVTYLDGTMHMGVTGSATTATNFIGAICGFALIGAFISDSYITRSTTILLFGPLMFLVIQIFGYSTIYIISIMNQENNSSIYIITCCLAIY